MTWQFRSSSKKIVISFDWHNDRNYRNLLAALMANKSSGIDFDDLTPGAINTSNISQIKRGLSTQIGAATHLLVIVGDHVNTRHPDSVLIGDRNWIWWEINKAKELGKKLIAVKINKDDEVPNPLKNAGATWALSYNVPAILKAINDV